MLVLVAPLMVLHLLLFRPTLPKARAADEVGPAAGRRIRAAGRRGSRAQPSWTQRLLLAAGGATVGAPIDAYCGMPMGGGTTHTHTP